MKRKLTYSRAVEILTAFLGSDIIVEEVGRGKGKVCSVQASVRLGMFDIGGTPIIERGTWEEVLRGILPNNLVGHKTNPLWEEINYVSQVYRFRHLGKAIKERSRLAVLCDTDEDGDTLTKVQRSTEQH